MPVSFGVVLVVNDEPITLMPSKAVKDLKANGFEVTLPHPVEIGSVAQGKAGLQSLVNRFTPEDEPFEMPTADELPEELQDVVKQLESVVIRIDEFHLRVPGHDARTRADDPEITRYTVGVSAMMPGDTVFNPAGLPVGLKGLFIRATNEGPVLDLTEAERKKAAEEKQKLIEAGEPPKN